MASSNPYANISYNLMLYCIGGHSDQILYTKNIFSVAKDRPKISDHHIWSKYKKPCPIY